MYIERIVYSYFRNYKEFTLIPSDDVTILIGPNAAGKTNLIEGIQLTTAAVSFRKAKAEQLIKHGSKQARVTNSLSGSQRHIEVVMDIDPTGRSYTVNNKKKRVGNIHSIVPAVLFSPDDLVLVKGSQRNRRAALDNLGVQLSSNYHAVKKDFEKILKQKNACLKEEGPEGFLQSIDEVFCSVAAQLYRLRLQLLKEVVPYIQEFYALLSEGKEHVDLVYIPSIFARHCSPKGLENIPVYCREEMRLALLQEIEQHRKEEYEKKRALIGPHLDCIDFYLDTNNASLFASQGQQRSLVLAYKMAEVEVIYNKLGNKPILLLDDVMSELDTARRVRFCTALFGEVQTFITSTHKEYFQDSFLRSAQIIEIEN